MDDANDSPTTLEGPQIGLRRGDSGSAHTERLVRETWRHYYVARLAEAQFGPDSLEASIAQSRALTSYRTLRGSLRAIDPYYRPPEDRRRAPKAVRRHLSLVRDDPPEQGESGQP
ncbi:MAG: hypothetical protein ABI026_00235 [Gemmatimonadaceae bacterium]